MVEKEIKSYTDVFQDPKHPFSVLLGGAKISTKIGVIENLLKIVDRILIGGGICFTFLKAKGYNIGKSLCETEKLDTAKTILKKTEELGFEFILPVDVVVAAEITNNAQKFIVPANEIPDDMIGVDIGPQTIELFKEKMNDSKVIFWNGPMGVFEIQRFAKGTMEIAHALSDIKDATTLIGGGESVMAANIAEIQDQISHISTGGGATLEFLEGKKLPGIDVLENKS